MIASYPPFHLERLLKTTLNPQKKEKLCILIDLEKPSDVVNFKFLKHPELTIQKKAHDIFYEGLRQGVMQHLGLTACDFFAYKMTGGSNLELPTHLTAPDGTVLQFDKDIYPHYNLILCISTYSATAPLTAAAKKYGFRGATMHGMNDIILSSGLAVDYNEVSQRAELLRKGMTHATCADIDFEVKGVSYHLHIDLGEQEAQKSHGICHEGGDIANLPAGEVYFVPTNASGSFPIKFEEDGSIGLMHVTNGQVDTVTTISGSPEIAKKYQAKFKSDPAAGILGELGFGTQVLPYSKADIQDEKIFGTFHIATGRNDHLSGSVTKDKFNDIKNATHEDILFSSTKTPEIHIRQVRLKKHNQIHTLIENYEPSHYLLGLLH